MRVYTKMNDRMYRFTFNKSYAVFEDTKTKKKFMVNNDKKWREIVNDSEKWTEILNHDDKGE